MLVAPLALAPAILLPGAARAGCSDTFQYYFEVKADPSRSPPNVGRTPKSLARVPSQADHLPVFSKRDGITSPSGM